MNDNSQNSNVEKLFNALNKKSHENALIDIFLSFMQDEGINGSYDTLRNNLYDYKENNRVDSKSITVDTLLPHVQSRLGHILGDLDIRKFIDVFFMDYTDTNFIKNLFKTMVVGITDDNYLDNIYTHNHCLRVEDNEDMSDTHKIFNKMVHLKNMEMAVSLATFTELYYQTAEGKLFFKKLESLLSQDTIVNIAYSMVVQSDVIIELSDVDLESTHDYFNELFTMMNSFSLRELFVTDINGHFVYTFETPYTLNGTYISFENNKIVISTGLTTDSENLAEGVSPLEHGVSYKFISEAIANEFSEKRHVHGKTDSEYWKSLTQSQKNVFVTNALINIFIKYDIIKNKEAVLGDYSEEYINGGFIVSGLKMTLFKINPTIIINKRLTDTGSITSAKLQAYFKNTNDFEFRMNYVTVT